MKNGVIGSKNKEKILSTLNRIPTRGSSIKGSHVYFLLQVFWVILLFCQIVLLFDINVILMLPWWPDVTIVHHGNYQEEVNMTACFATAL